MSSTALQVAPTLLPTVTADGLQAYLQRINRIPLLTEEEEKTLATRYHTQSDLLAAQQLVLSHLRYVARIAKVYQGYGLALADLIQEGSIGLMKAVKRFNPAVGVRLAAFAVHWIKAEMHEFIIRNWRIVKMATTKAQRKLFFNLRQTKKRLGWFSIEEVHAVAKDLGVTPKEVMEMETRLNAQDDSFEQHAFSEDQEVQRASPAYYLQATVENEPAYQIIEANSEEDLQTRLQGALKTLDSRSRDIISQRQLGEQKASLKELAQKYALSIERVRQIEKAALLQLRNHLSALTA